MFKFSVCMIALFFALNAAAAVAQNSGLQSGITVKGDAVVKAKPDVAYVSFGVVSEAKEATFASQENARKTSAVIDAVIKFGIPKADIETLQYSLSPMIDYAKRPQVTTGYRASNTIRVRVKDLSKVGPLIDVAIKAGANNIQGISYDVDDKDRYRREALAQAAKNAHMDAEVMAKTLGVRLGGVVAAAESGGYSPVPLEYGALKAAEVSTPIILGEIDINASVTVVYAIFHDGRDISARTKDK